MVYLLVFYILYSRLPIGQLNRPLLTKHNCVAVHTKLEGYFFLNCPLFFYASIILYYSGVVAATPDLMNTLLRVSAFQVIPATWPGR